MWLPLHLTPTTSYVNLSVFKLPSPDFGVPATISAHHDPMQTSSTAQYCRYDAHSSPGCEHSPLPPHSAMYYGMQAAEEWAHRNYDQLQSHTRFCCFVYLGMLQSVRCHRWEPQSSIIGHVLASQSAEWKTVAAYRSTAADSIPQFGFRRVNASSYALPLAYVLSGPV